MNNYNKNRTIKICNESLFARPQEQIKYLTLSKENESVIEMLIENSLRITPIFAGPTRSEEDECASPIKMKGDSNDLYY